MSRQSRITGMPRLMAVALAALALSGCTSPIAQVLTGGSDPSGTQPGQAEIPPGATEVSADVVEEMFLSGIPDRRRVIIRDAGEWAALWDELQGNVHPQPDVPAVDFGSDMLLVATMGQRNTGGYAISFANVYDNDGELFATVTEFSPAATCLTTQALSAPAVVIVVPRDDRPVSFMETTDTFECG